MSKIVLLAWLKLSLFSIYADALLYVERAGYSITKSAAGKCSLKGPREPACAHGPRAGSLAVSCLPSANW